MPLKIHLLCTLHKKKGSTSFFASPSLLCTFFAAPSEIKRGPFGSKERKNQGEGKVKLIEQKEETIKKEIEKKKTGLKLLSFTSWLFFEQDVIKKFSRPVGLEPTTFGFGDQCSTN